jgi:hypothetical protein
VKRSGRDEPMWVAIDKCMEATVGNSLYSSYVFSSTKSENGRGMDVAHTMYTHVSKCKSNKRKEKN